MNIGDSKTVALIRMLNLEVRRNVSVRNASAGSQDP